MNSRKLLIGCGFVMILGVGALVIGMITTSLPGVEQQIPAGMGSSLVNISLPLNGAQLPLNQPISVYVQAFGNQPIQEIQLLVDGVPQPNGSSSPAGEKKMMAAWAFTPDKEGTHTLLARAITQGGQAGASNAVTVNILPLDQMPLPIIQGGAATPQIINDEIGGADLEGGTPAPAPPGFNDQGDVDNPPPPFPTEPPGQEPPAEPSQQPGDNLIPSKYALWFQKLFGANLPIAPTLDGGANQCDGILVVQDNSTDELGFFLYRLDPGQQAFNRIATLDGKAGKAAFSYHDPGLASGQYLYYLSAFNAGGESASNIISLTVDAPQCVATNKPEFDAESISIDIGQPADKAYCYGSASGMPWVRLPYGQNNFIYPVNNKINLAPYWNLIPLPQPTPSQVTLNMECWGWSSSTLFYLGASSQTVSGGNSPTPPPGQDGTLGEPPKNLIANPYNAFISNDPNDCQDHVPNNPAAVQQCKDYMTSNASGYFLFWDYNRYGDCNPQAEYCDMSFQPADSFHIYTIKAGQAVSYPIGSLGVNYRYVPAFDQAEKEEYFVRAFSSTYGESGDSNHVFFSKPVMETTIDPTSLKIDSLEAYGDGTPTQWYSYPPNGGVLFSGYAFMPLNGNYRDVWAESTVTFNLPENMNIQGARLNWKNKSYSTSGPGANNWIKNCGVYLNSGPGGWPLAPSVPGGSENYNVSDAVLNAKLKGQQSIDFLFMGPRILKPSVRPDACLWYINNLSLTLYYNE